MPPYRPFVPALANKPTFARLALISQLTSTSPLLGQKVRLAGRALAVDTKRYRVLLEYQGKAVLVDLSLCLQSGHLPRLRDVIMVLGDLELRADDDRELPALELDYPPPELDDRVIVTAIILTAAKDDNDLDLAEWAASVELAST